VAPGLHEVRASLASYSTEKRDVRAVEHEKQVVVLELQRDTESAAVSTTSCPPWRSESALVSSSKRPQPALFFCLAVMFTGYYSQEGLTEVS
jgi:hypothetical protein